MKKIILAIFLIFSCFWTSTVGISAQINDTYYFGTIIEEYSEQSTRATSTKTASKTVTVKNSSNVALWSVKVTGTFTFNGSSSSCTNASVTTAVYDKNWKIASKSASKSGNSAIATAKGNCYLDGSYISSLTKTAKLTCNATGKLS